VSALGALAGLAAAGSVLLLLSWLLARRPLPVADRVGPYVGIPGHTAVVRRDIPVASVLAALGVRRSTRSTTSARRGAGLIGALAGVSIAALLTVREPQPVAWIALAVVGAVLGVWISDAQARLTARRRAQRITEQVPVLADLLALSVSAGAGPVLALDRASAHLRGPLAEEVKDALARIRSGDPMEAALRPLGDGVPVLRRLIDAVLVSVEQGAPLGDVLRAQALDARAEERRRLMEGAGRKDVAMLVPIVFLVLPTVVLIALYPGLQALTLVVP